MRVVPLRGAGNKKVRKNQNQITMTFKEERILRGLAIKGGCGAI
jgi:hypothetical protein